jgi:hypothetical protein
LLAIFTSTRTMQNLNTVAKAFEVSPEGGEPAEVTAKRQRLEVVRKELKKLEQQFGKTPETDKAKRTEIHLEAEKRRKEIKELEASIPETEFVLCVEEGSEAGYGTQPRNLHLQVRGNYVTAGEEAPAIFPRIISGEKQSSFVEIIPDSAMKPTENKIRFGHRRASSGRMEFANWIVSKDNPLTARVFVNRVWKHHFGEGIVRSPDNFGKLGERPTHPPLLDWLAEHFMESGWSIKQLHRTMLLSSAYQMASDANPQAVALDPENRLLSHYPRRRLEAEPIRDAMLAVGGNLDRTMGGSLLNNGNFEYINNEHSRGEVRYGSTRRSIYVPVIRNNLYPFFQTFDFPEPSVMNGDRDSTVIAPQALFLLNSPFALKQAQLFAERLQKSTESDQDRVKLAYRLAYGREVTSNELQRATAFVSQVTAMLEGTDNDATQRQNIAWAALAQSIFASSEFIYVR